MIDLLVMVNVEKLAFTIMTRKYFVDTFIPKPEFVKIYNIGRMIENN